MTNRDLALKILSGEKTDSIPFFPDISDWYKVKRLPKEQVDQFPTGCFIADDLPLHGNNLGMPEEFADWTYLDFYRNFNWGLHVHIYDWCSWEYENCDHRIVRQDDRIIREFHTPLGSISHVDGVAKDGSLSPVEHYVKSSADWKILRYVVEHTQPKADFRHISQILAGIGDMGIADIVIWRSPFGKILNEYAGLETTVFHLMDEPDLIQEILELQTEKDLAVIRLAAASPADIVIISDHADEQILNPVWYEKYCLPFYHQANEILHAKGKFVSTHLDGNFKGLFPLVKKTGFDLLDGCTPAPMTNYEIEELPAAMTATMKAYLGVPSTFFTDNTPIGIIKQYAGRIVNTLRGKVIMNIGDILPADGDIYKAMELGKWVAERF